MGGRHSVQGFFDDMNLLTLNPYSVDAMKDFVETHMGKCAGEKDGCSRQQSRGHLGMGFVWPIMGNRYWREGGEGETQKTKAQKPLLWPLCFHWTLDLGKTCCLEN